MATEVSHKDPERKGVGQTAHGVASMRAWESAKGEAALIYDPYAAAFGGKWGEDWLVNGFKEKFNERADFISGIAIRTKKIDSLLQLAVTEQNITQICVLGAGLDSRPWRLHLQRPKEEPAISVDASNSPELTNLFREVQWLEVDFPEIFAFKHACLDEAGASLACKYKSISLDLSLPEWPATLISAGFNVEIPTLWLLEGFTGYLTESELISCFEKINTLSVPGSKLLATFIGESFLRATVNIHKFRTDDPLSFISRFGWCGECFSFDSLAAEYNREWVSTANLFGAYKLVFADLGR